MFNLNEIKGLIFDCDGTLLDSMGAWDDAERDLFAEAGEMTFEEEAELHASDIEDACAILHDRFGVGESSEALFAYFEGILMDFYSNKVKALPGACELVRTAQDAGVPCVVLSSSPRRYLEAGLERAGILDCFAELVTTGEAGVPKTDPAIYRKAMDIMGSTLETTWAFDDAVYAVRVMESLGIRTVAPLNGRAGETEEQLREAATLVVNTLEELL